MRSFLLESLNVNHYFYLKIAGDSISEIRLSIKYLANNTKWISD
jgi:hypothetical protein